MRRFAPVLLTMIPLIAAGQARADLAADVKRALAGPALARAQVGVQVLRLGQVREQDEVLVSVNGDEPRVPASNLKIITTAAVLDTLGPDFRFRTSLLSDGENVALVGDGDPTLGDSEFLSKTDWTITTVFEKFADSLKQQRVTQVKDVLVDDSIFEEMMLHPKWPTEQAHLEYVPQVAGINFNANCLDVFVTQGPGNRAGFRTDPATNYVQVENQASFGDAKLFLSRVLGTNRVILKGTTDGPNRAPFRVTIHDPPMFAGTVLAETLKKHGITITGNVTRDRTVRAATAAAGTQPSSRWRLIAAHETPLQPVLDKTNKDSVNLYAESIGKRLAAQVTGKPGSWASLSEAQAAFMKKVGAPGDAVFDDGCGLSKANQVAPAGFCATLAYMFHGEQRAAFLQSLAIGGVDGTLSRRFRANGLAGRVFAKSGSVRGVSTLSGYLKTQSGEWFAFSVLINNVGDIRAAQTAQDAIVKAIDANAD